MSKISKSAKGQECMVRIPGVCNFNPETTVLAHLNGFGVGTKAPDYLAAYCCSACHAVIDGHTKSQHSADEIKIFHYEGVFRTQEILAHGGLIKA